MKLIRKGTFETNSSSTHAIVIPKNVEEDKYSLYDSLDHEYCFGRGAYRLVDAWDEKLAYSYMALKDNGTTKEELKSFKDNVIEIWKTIDKNKTTPTPIDVFNYLDRDGKDGNLTGNDSFLVLMDRGYNYIDHSSELNGTGFIERLKTDIDFLKRFLFNKDSYITIGGDEYCGYNIKTIGFEYDYEDYNEFENKLDKYMEDNDVYLKGN